MQPIVPFVAALALCSSAALAQDAAAPPPPDSPMMGRMHFDKAEMEKHRAQMCSDHYARAVGKLAYLETKLALTDQQKPAFERWKDVKLTSAKAHSAACATRQWPGPDASIMERVKMQTKHLQDRLAELKAETPSLEALVGTLSAEQQKALQRVAMEVRHERMEAMEGMGGMRQRMMLIRRDGDDVTVRRSDGDMPSPAQ